MTRIAGWVAAAAVLMVVGVSDASAQMSMGSFHGYLTGHIGAVTAGETDGSTFTGGVSLSVQETTGWGAEIDFGHAGDVATGAQRLDVNTYMLNAMYVAPDRRVRPFALAGAGVMEVNGCPTPCNISAKTYDLGISAGGGAFLLLNDMFGVRGDVRYFWSNSDHPDLGRPENFRYWRLSVGVTYLWTIAP